MLSTESLKGKRALVTGAGRGIGRACAVELDRCGAELVITARSRDELDSLAEELHSCCAVTQDLSRVDELEDFVHRIQSQAGPVDILVNNAGSYHTDHLDDADFAAWQNALDLNLSSPYRLTQLLAVPMKERNWGRVVNISSISGQRGEAYGASYSSTKFGLLGLTQALALELAEHGVTVNAVCPGWVDTKLAREQLNDPHWCKLNGIDVEESVDIATLSVPQKRLLAPAEVAYLVSFLCTEGAFGITGQSINICGGLSLT